MNRRKFSQIALGAAVAQTVFARTSFAAGTAEASDPSGVSFRFSSMLGGGKAPMPPEQAIGMLADAGYVGIELVGQYKTWSPEQTRSLMALMSSRGLIFDSMAPARLTLADPAEADAVKQQMTAAIAAAKDLGCSQFILTSGPRVPAFSPTVQRQAIIDNLKIASDITSKEGINIVLEPIDLIENKNASVSSVTDGFEIVRAIGNSNVKVLYDFYHEQRAGGNLLEKLENNIDYVGLCHIADVPGRHQPGTGEINFAAIFRKLAQLKYSRFVAMEFSPIGDPVTVYKAARLDAIQAAKGA